MILNSRGYFEIVSYIVSIGFASFKIYCKLFVFCLCLSYLCYVNQYIKAMFKSTLNKGFQITFNNGLTISVQFGSGNYCTNRNETFNGLSRDVITSQSAEIAIWDKDGKWFDFGPDTVKGYCSPDEVAKWVNRVSRAKSLKYMRKG